MRAVVVLGGYGGFGARLSRRLAAEGWTVIVAGRNLEKAQKFAATLRNARAVRADRNGDLSELLSGCRPLLLIDAAGPFQASGYRAVETCLACGVHYLDLADARDFVGGIRVLDQRAKAAGLVVLSGASSVPALSSAVIAELGDGMDEFYSVSMAISASSQAAAGASVASAILSVIGRPLKLWRGKRWCRETGWHMLSRVRYVVKGRPQISRLVALADVPDHDLVPAMAKGSPATIFRAGPESAAQLLALWLLSWPVAFGWISSLSRLAPWLLPLQKTGARLGTNRSAMMVEVKGRSGNGFYRRRWTLIAERGDGPEIPVMAAQLLAAAIAEGKVSAGARPAAGELSLQDFDVLLDAIESARQIDSESYVPLYRRVMGEDYTRLPEAVRQMHDIFGDAGAHGMATVTRGRSPAARLVAGVMGFPPEGEHDLHVSFSETEGREVWTRDFGGHVFVSELSKSGKHLVERFGPMRFYFDLPSDGSGLTMMMRAWSIFRVRMPLFLAPRSVAREWAEGGDFCFDVPIALPLVGALVHYRGRLRRM